jgi:hypothetical protein
MDVRQVRPTDAPLVLSLAIDESSHLVKSRDWPQPTPLVRTLARAALPLALRGGSWIARDGSSVAFLEAEPRQYVIGWDLTRLAVRGDPCAVLGPVVKAATAHLQSRGVPRLFARCEKEHRDTLRSVEFHSLAQEYVLVGPHVVVGEDANLPLDSRYRMPQDAWPLHQLEVESTPAMVRQFEGLSSQDWSQKHRMTEIVVEKDGRIAAWIGWGDKSRHGYVPLSMLIHEKHSDLGPDLLRHAAKNLPAGRQFVTRVRSYHVESLQTFLDAKFQIVTEEGLMVKHAGVELAREAPARLRVAGVPSIQALPIRIGVPDPIPIRPTREDRHT